MFKFLSGNKETKQKSKNQATVKLERKDESSSSFSLYRTDFGIFAYSHYSVNEIIRDFERISPLSTAINKVANSVANLPMTIVDIDSQEELNKHAAQKLLKYPNSEHEKIKSEFIKSFITWKILHGNAYVMVTGSISGQPIEMYILSSDRVVHHRDINGYTSKLGYYTDAGVQEFMKNPVRDSFVNKSGNQEVFHVRGFNTDPTDLQGTSEIESLQAELSIYLHCVKHNNAMLKNGVRPSGAFVLKQNGSEDNAMLSEDEYERLKQSIAESYSGAENAGIPMVLEGGIEWQQMSLSPKDMDFDNLVKSAESQIYKKLDIPLQLISSGNVSLNNVSQLRLEFYQNKIIPLGEEFCAYFNRYITSRYRDSARVELVLDRDKIDVLLESRIKFRESIEKSTTLYINEKRKMFKMKPIEGGNVIVDPNGRHIAGEDAESTVGGQNNNLNQTQD